MYILNDKFALGICLLASSLLMARPGACTSPVAPYHEYYGIDRQSLISLHKDAYKKAGLLASNEVAQLDENGGVVILSFDYLENGSLLLKDALELRITSQGPEAARCGPWPCASLNPIVQTSDDKLSSAIWDAYAKATANINNQVLDQGGFVKAQN